MATHTSAAPSTMFCVASSRRWKCCVSSVGGSRHLGRGNGLGISAATHSSASSGFDAEVAPLRASATLRKEPRNKPGTTSARPVGDGVAQIDAVELPRIAPGTLKAKLATCGDVGRLSPPSKRAADARPGDALLIAAESPPGRSPRLGTVVTKSRPSAWGESLSEEGSCTIAGFGSSAAPLMCRLAAAAAAAASGSARWRCPSVSLRRGALVATSCANVVRSRAASAHRAATTARLRFRSGPQSAIDSALTTPAAKHAATALCSSHSRTAVSRHCAAAICTSGNRKQPSARRSLGGSPLRIASLAHGGRPTRMSLKVVRAKATLWYPADASSSRWREVGRNSPAATAFSVNAALPWQQFIASRTV
mmetsp:Transcript_14771/g.45816  ORF Transcript_14771/g.45816 Transcript_14771/m.45816 type:complete len:365 (-) Transcript_14771:1053-2147(-)